jgi:hypothetical protein
MTEVVKYFRIVDSDIADHAPIVQEMFVVKKTPKGAWLAYSWSRYEWLQKVQAEEELTSDMLRYWGARIVYDAARRKFAYPTLTEALASYRIRKERQIQHAENTLRHAKRNLDYAKCGEVQNEVMIWSADEREDRVSQPWSPNKLI